MKVYIASPYTNGYAGDNVRRQLEAMKILMDHGFIPFVPLLTHFAEINHHRPEQDWLDWDLAWLKVCDVMVRIRPTDEDGVEISSSGADIEEKMAEEEGLLVFNFKNLQELEYWASTTEKNGSN